MSRDPKGEVYSTDAGLVARVTIEGKRRASLPLASMLSLDEAKERTEVLAKLARQFRRAGIAGSPIVAKLLDMAAAASPPMLPGVLQTAKELLGGELIEAGAVETVPTFADVAKDWTSGELHERFENHVKAKNSEADERRFRILFEIDLGGTKLGDIPIDRFTLDHAEQAMRQLPERAKRAGTRRHYAQLISRVLSLSVYPLRLIERNPLPKGFLPKIGKPPAFPFLYPKEDAALLSSAEVPFADRILYGFLAREGMRVSEATSLQWRDVDLDLGTVALDENKTHDSRSWALDAGVLAALRSLHNRVQPKPTALVFVSPNGGSYEAAKLADRFRGHLLVASVTRAELHQDGVNRRKIRAHDLRATFITLALAQGKTETWVADRTGHGSSAMINRYRRQARTAKELDLGALRPLDLALSWDESPSIAHADTLCEDAEDVQPSVIAAEWPLGGMADAEDLKSFSSNGVPVRVREGPPKTARVSCRADLRGKYLVPLANDVPRDEAVLHERIDRHECLRGGASREDGQGGTHRFVRERSNHQEGACVVELLP